MPYNDGPLEAVVEPSDTVDADPSDALTSQIASSILRERYGVDSAEAVPLKVQEAVRACLRDVSSTVEHEHPQWGLPTYRSAKGSRSAKNGLDKSPKGHSRKANSDAPRSRKRGLTQPGEEDDDPFQYDRRKPGNGLGDQHDGIRELAVKKKAKLRDVFSGYPCPYRRRNPVLFNVREHEHCARRNFADMTELKSVYQLPLITGHPFANQLTGDMYEHITDNKGLLTSAHVADRGLLVKTPCLAISQFLSM